jgi:7-keto-8-aminopelargonate synthetase-like enzyme
MEYLRDRNRPNDGYLTESQSDNEWKRVTEVKKSIANLQSNDYLSL